MSKVRIMSDSTCDLSEELLIQYDIAVLPHPIVRDGELLQDNVSITPDDIYAHYERTGRLCTTSAPNAYDYEQFWRPWLDEGQRESVCLYWKPVISGIRALLQKKSRQGFVKTLQNVRPAFWWM